MQQQLLKVLSDTLNLPESELNSASSTETIKQWDSLMQMNIIFAVEDSFGVTIPDDKLSEATSVAAILNILQQEA